MFCSSEHDLEEEYRRSNHCESETAVAKEHGGDAQNIVNRFSINLVRRQTVSGEYVSGVEELAVCGACCLKGGKGIDFIGSQRRLRNQ